MIDSANGQENASAPYRYNDDMMRRFYRAEKLVQKYDTIPTEKAEARNALVS